MWQQGCPCPHSCITSQRHPLPNTHGSAVTLCPLYLPALRINGIKIVPQLLVTLRGDVISKFLTSAISKRLVFLLTSKSPLGEAPFESWHRSHLHQSKQMQPFLGAGQLGSSCGLGFAVLGRRVDGKLLTDVNRSCKRRRKSWAPRRLRGCACVRQQRRSGQAHVGGTRGWHDASSALESP